MEIRTDMPMVAVGVFLLKGTKFLLGKRKGSRGAGFYSLPGGHIEKGETLVSAAVRELEEETGIVCREGNRTEGVFCFETGKVICPNMKARVLTAVDEFFPDEDVQYVTIYLLLHCEDADEPVNTEPDKCEGWEWFDVFGEMPSPLHPPLNEGILSLQTLLMLLKKLRS